MQIFPCATQVGTRLMSANAGRHSMFRVCMSNNKTLLRLFAWKNFGKWSLSFSRVMTFVHQFGIKYSKYSFMLIVTMTMR